MKKIGIYIHIPFCKRACFYCHFVKQEYDAHLAEKYIDALVKEIHLRSNPAYLIDSIYIGGGSPSLLRESQVSAIIKAITDHSRMVPSPECTLEVNPEDISLHKLRGLKDLGINRLSIGTQSFIPKDLHYLKRTHDARQSAEAIENALAAGFANINVDFIISLPSQTRKTLKENFSMLKNYDIPHVSAYLLEEVEDSEAKNARDHKLYFFTRDFLQGLGYIHYEVSNFSFKGFHSRHNLGYWENKSYIGVGLSASGYEQGWDYKNTCHFREYFEALHQQKFPQAEVKRSDPVFRRVVMGSRLFRGISISAFQNYREPLEMLISEGFLIKRGGRIAVNPQKILLLNEILTYFPGSPGSSSTSNEDNVG